MDHPRPPIDLPDDFGTEESHADTRVTTWAAAALVAVAAIAALLIAGVLA